MSKTDWRIIEALQWASSFLNKAGNAHELLLQHHLGCDRTGLLLQLRDNCPPSVLAAFKEHVHLHKQGVPVQYLIGEEQFYGRSFLVNEAVLIPRPETEELIQLILKKINNRFANKQTIASVDVGTGSGVIAITLALEEQKTEVTAIDLSAEALAVASKNAKRLQACNVSFLQGDLFEPVITTSQRFDVIVSNPPYIESEEIAALDIGVREHEPLSALDGGADGYNFYRRMIKSLQKVMREQVIVGFEVGVGQSNTVADLLRSEFPTALIETTYDINQKDRIVTAEIGF